MNIITAQWHDHVIESRVVCLYLIDYVISFIYIGVRVCGVKFFKRFYKFLTKIHNT